MDYLDLAFLTQCPEKVDLIRVTYANKAYFPLVLECHEDSPGFESVIYRFQRAVQDVTVQVIRMEVFEGIAERLGDLVPYGLRGVIRKRLLSVLSG